MNRILTVNFGTSNKSLTTVGYTLINADGTEIQPRTTSGVLELGTATGIYGISLSMSDTFTGTIRWDTGETSPQYAVEDINLAQTSSALADEVRTLLRSHLNQLIDFIDKRIEKIKPEKIDFDAILKPIKSEVERIAKIKPKDPEKIDYDAILKPLLIAIKSANDSISKAEKALLSAVSDRKDKDYSPELETIKSAVSTAHTEVLAAFRDLPNHTEDINALAMSLDEIKVLISKLPKTEEIATPMVKELDMVHISIAEAINGMVKATADERRSARDIFKGGMDKILGILKDVRNEMGGNALSQSEGLKIALELLRKLENDIWEINPDTIAAKQLRAEQINNNLSLLLGTKHG